MIINSSASGDADSFTKKVGVDRSFAFTAEGVADGAYAAPQGPPCCCPEWLMEIFLETGEALGEADDSLAMNVVNRAVDSSES